MTSGLKSLPPDQRGRAAGGLKLYAHRGDSAHHPENTLPAFRAALDQGADAVELDLRQSRDGALVVSHDRRLTGADGTRRRISGTPWHELQKLAVGAPGSSETAPPTTFDEVTAALGGRIQLQAEAKTLGAAIQIARRARAGGYRGDQLEISSFNPFALLAARMIAPQLPRSQLMHEPVPVWLWSAAARVVGASSVRPSDAMATPRNVARLGQGGKRPVGVYTVDDAERARELAAMGVDHIFTNRPGELRAQLEAIPAVATQQP